jgi:nitrite reductase/ring-hydroxylating ferredoxin subunit
MSDPNRIHAGKVGDYVLDQYRIVEVPGGSIGVVRTQRGFFAVRNRCPHMGADICDGMLSSTLLPGDEPFEFRVAYESSIVRCPWHRWEFLVDTGEAVGRITKKKLITYPVEVDRDDVYVLRKAAARARREEAAVS